MGTHPEIEWNWFENHQINFRRCLENAPSVLACTMVNGQNTHGDLFGQGRYINLAKGEVLHHPDEPCRAMGLVISGEIRLSRMLSTGKELYLKVFGIGDLFAELIVFTGEKYPGRLTATESSRIVEVKLPQVLEYLNNHNALISFFAGIAGKMSHLSDMIEVQSLKTVRQKIAFSLLYGKTGNLSSDSSKDLCFRINVSQFAGYLDCSREAVSRALSQMESDGMIVRGGGYLKIEDRTKLDSLL